MRWEIGLDDRKQTVSVMQLVYSLPLDIHGSWDEATSTLWPNSKQNSYSVALVRWWGIWIEIEIDEWHFLNEQACYIFPFNYIKDWQSQSRS